MEKIPNFKVVGKIEEEYKELITERARSLVYENHLGNMDEKSRKELEENELPKTEEESEFIRMANEYTNELLKSSGIETYDVPERNFHKIGLETYKKYKSGTMAGHFEEKYKAIMLNAELISDRLYEALVIFHELLHMKSYLAHYVFSDKDDDRVMLRATKYREGVDVKSASASGDSHEHFYGLNEAIVACEEKRYLQKIIQTSLFLNEKKELLSPDTYLAKEYLLRKKKISEDEIISINLLKGRYLSVGYQKQRKVLEYLCEEISHDTNRSVREIHEKFLQSQLTGKLIFLAKIIENSFGKGSFRELGNMRETKKSAVATLKFLKSSRLKLASQ